MSRKDTKRDARAQPKIERSRHDNRQGCQTSDGSGIRNRRLNRGTEVYMHISTGKLRCSTRNIPRGSRSRRSCTPSRKLRQAPHDFSRPSTRTTHPQPTIAPRRRNQPPRPAPATAAAAGTVAHVPSAGKKERAAKGRAVRPTTPAAVDNLRCVKCDCGKPICGCHIGCSL